MKKVISCSFDELGVVITAWNGVHPDKPGHFSVTKTMSREDWNDACENRGRFSEILGTDITKGWQNALAEVINNAKRLHVDMDAMTRFLVDMLAKYHGDKAEEVFAQLAESNQRIEEAVMQHCEAEEQERAKKMAAEDEAENPQGGLDPKTIEEDLKATLGEQAAADFAEGNAPVASENGTVASEQDEPNDPETPSEPVTEETQPENKGEENGGTVIPATTRKSRKNSGRKNDTPIPDEAGTGSDV